MMPTPLKCPNCGAPIAYGATSCGYCRAAIDMRAFAPRQLARNLLTAWKITDPARSRFIDGNPVVLRTDVSPPGGGSTAARALSAPGLFDDIDVSVTIQFVAVGAGSSYAGFEFREVPSGSYRTVISSSGMFRVGTWIAPKEYGTLVPWTVHPAIATQPGAPNRVRLIAAGKQIRVELNEVPAASVVIQQHFAGGLSLYAGCEHGPMSVVFSDLNMRDPRG